jgi:hypothetical protein
LRRRMAAVDSREEREFCKGIFLGDERDHRVLC